MSKTQRAAERLVKKHAELDERVAELDARHALTASEELELRQLKKTKLQVKDALTAQK